MAYLKQVIGDDDIQLRVVEGKNPAGRAAIHGNGERVPVTTIAQTAEFYVRFLRHN